MIGIGGISMSAIAETLHNWNYKVTGSDLVQSNITDTLNNHGIPTTIGHDIENAKHADLIVFSAAISDSDPEILVAKEQVNLAKEQVDLAKQQVILAETKASEQVELAKEQVILAKAAVDEAQEIVDSVNGNFLDINLSNINEVGQTVIKNLAAEVGTNLPVGTILPVFCSATYVPEGFLPCDGAEYTKSQFSIFYEEWLISKKLNTCTYSEYQSDIDYYGECLKFAVDETNLKFKVPMKKNEYNILKDEAPVVGNGLSIGFTNGTEEFSLGFAPNYNNWSQAGFVSQVNLPGTGSQVTYGGAVGISKDALKSGVIADLSEIKQSLLLRYFVVVATTSINESEMDWSEWASSLQGKLNLDHSNDTKPYIVETYANETSWYRIWSDNWCEQGGIIQVANIFTIELLKAYKDMNYIGFVTGRYSSAANYSYNCHFYPITNNSATIYIGSSSQNICQWKCVGYV